ncbi:hypothetical protein Plec18167_007952 [Paecilomyces lecythidis]|uniref:MYB transcription factor n=1 Tax=Paecilomyces lecythidis TaxID=3004212 RepID=A0ABR3WZY7_9EURO
MIVVQNPVSIPSAKVDISLLLKPQDEEGPAAPRASATSSRTILTPVAPSAAAATATSTASTFASSARPASSGIPSSVPAKRLQSAHPAESPAKKQSKWSPEEDALIIELRGSGMKWEDISKRLPGRSAISCRLHYQNYLERRSEWDEDRKNKLARLYERFKAEMWAKVAEEMAIPWRAAEAMHWQLGEQEMARRAGVVPFSLSNTSIDPPATKHRRGNTVMPRLRSGSAPRPPPPQLPSVEELTAGVPAYAPLPLPPRNPYQIRGSPPEFRTSLYGPQVGGGSGPPPRTHP